MYYIYKFTDSYKYANCICEFTYSHNYANKFAF